MNEAHRDRLYDEATSKVENSAQGSFCKLKFVHGPKVSLKGVLVPKKAKSSRKWPISYQASQ
jgi:hypothetical protein